MPPPEPAVTFGCSQLLAACCCRRDEAPAAGPNCLAGTSAQKAGCPGLVSAEYPCRDGLAPNRATTDGRCLKDGGKEDGGRSYK